MDLPDLRPRPRPRWKMLLWPLLVAAVGCVSAILWQQWRQEGRPAADTPRTYQSSPVGVMGTKVYLTAVAPASQEKKARRALDEAEAVLRDVEAHMSSWLNGTEISLLNSAPAGEVVELSEPTMEVLRLARRLATESDGAFDVTCRPIVELWKQAGKTGRLPGDAEIEQARQATGWRHIELLERGARKKIAQAGIDLGGIAKGYSSDQAAEAMKATGIASGIVAVAGDIRCFGRRADGGRWGVAIRDPFHADQTIAVLEAGEMGVSTSGNYFRFVRIEGKPYSHIVDPRTGRPVDFAPSVTVIAPTAALADAWATGLSVLGHEGLKRVGGKTGIEALVFEGGPEDYKLYATEGFADFLAQGEKLPKPVTIVTPGSDEDKLDLHGRANLLAGGRVLLAAGESERFDERVSLDRGYQELRLRIEFAAPPAADGDAQFLLRSNRYISTWTLNGRPIPQPLAEMRYNVAGPIRAGDLQSGANVLEAYFTTYLMDSRSGPAGEVAELQVALVEVQPEDLAVRMGPILGYAGEDFFTVTCRTDVPAEVALKVGDKKWTSPAGYHHLLKATGLAPGTPYEYALEARLGAGSMRREIVCGPYRTRTLPRTGTLVFAAMGDNREGTKIWHAVSEHVRTSGAHFALHTGDMVDYGRSDKCWQIQFYQPAREFCASVPGYYVPGNHEDDTPAFTRLFATPSGQKNWHQRIGPVLLIGLDSDQGDWTSGSTDFAWLEGVLAGGADAKFIFLACHYPAYSAGKGGWESSRPVFELLEKHRATAMIAGDAHGYERSEPGRGTTMIVSAGAGAPLYSVMDPKAYNPHSMVFCPEYNYCLFTVEGDTCTMRAYGLGDQDEPAPPRVIDTRAWKARQR